MRWILIVRIFRFLVFFGGFSNNTFDIVALSLWLRELSAFDLQSKV
jgi:hypothetical protein